MSSSFTSNQNNLSFIDIPWLNATGGLYNSSQVLEYFYCSPFYDKNCKNEELRVQSICPTVDLLVAMEGIQYICDETPELPYNIGTPVFIVKKIERKSDQDYDLLDVFYCIEGTFYKSPDFFELIKARYQKLSHHVKTSFISLASNVKYDVDATFVFPDGQALASEKLMMRQLSNRYQHIMDQYPTMTGVYDDLDKLVASFRAKEV